MCRRRGAFVVYIVGDVLTAWVAHSEVYDENSVRDALG